MAFDIYGLTFDSRALTGALWDHDTRPTVREVGSVILPSFPSERPLNSNRDLPLAVIVEHSQRSQKPKSELHMG